MGCNFKFDSLNFGVQYVTEYECHEQCTYTSFVTIINHGVKLLMEFGFCWPTKFDHLT
jgi:hypothetical protein